jgi:hypothetical protein
LIAGIVLGVESLAPAATFPSATGSGFFTYDGSALTLDSITGLSQIFYSPTESTFSPLEDVAISATAELTGVTRIGASLVFTDGTFSITAGSDVLMTADIIDVELMPTSSHTANINPGLSMINLENVVVAQPSSGTSRFITDWLTAAQASGRGVIGLSLVNTNAGSLNPLVPPAGGNVVFSLEPTNEGAPGPHIVPADRDEDGDVDGIDFSVFASCFNQAGNPPRTLGCDEDSRTALDFDDDGDIDGIDFSKFAACFNGAGNPPRSEGCPQN